MRQQLLQEAMTLARRVWQGSDDAAFVIDSNLHPHVKAVIETRAKPLKINVIESDFKSEVEAEIFAAIIAYPNSTGEIKNIKPIIEKIQSRNALAIVDCDLLALTLFKSPGSVVLILLLAQPNASVCQLDLVDHTRALWR